MRTGTQEDRRTGGQEYWRTRGQNDKRTVFSFGVKTFDNSYNSYLRLYINTLLPD